MSAWILGSPLFVIGVVAVVFIMVALFRWLWNTTMPDLFGVKAVTYWQAFRLLIIATMLFGSGGAIGN